jgi:trehalose 6-phosphate phosphatase
MTPDLPPFAGTALLLDMDGTLLDIAPTPDAVVVPDGLLDCLRGLRTALGGALAVISGRPVEQLDALLADAPHAVAGEHGGAIRHAPGAPLERPVLPSVPAAMRAAAKVIALAHPGVLFEPKEHGFVLHYRAVPTLGPTLRAELAPLVAREPGAFVLMQARKAWEVRPAGADKGTALRALMARPPFAGRLPLFVGDDVTDRDAIAAAQAMGGAGLFVPETLGTPDGVRAWLAASLREGAWQGW